MSAQIIAFPASSVTLPPDDPQQRLRRAVAALDAAVAVQRRAVGEWRESLARLQAAMHGLGTSLAQYRDNLDRVGSEVAAVNAQARALESWADSALVCAGQAG